MFVTTPLKQQRLPAGVLITLFLFILYIVPQTIYGQCAADQTAAEFGLGAPDANTLVALQGDGGVILQPTLNEEFSGNTVPAGWTDAIWDGQPGAITTFSGGQATVNGTHLSYNTPVSPGIALEFVATFTAGNFQNIGFTGDAAFNNPWVVIGRGGQGDNNVYARSSDNQSVSLGSTLLNAPHTYRIVWLAGTNTFNFYVDGVLIATPVITITVGTDMIVQISDYPAGGAALSADWLRISPFAAGGSYTSRVFDQGVPNGWGAVNWTAATPAGTSIAVSVRTGNTPSPDGSWTAFLPVTNGATIGGSVQYLQYRADLSTSDNQLTPVLEALTVGCGTGPDITPPVITNVLATPAGNGLSATVSWTTDEAANSQVIYGTSPGALTSNVTAGTLVVSHNLLLAGLSPATTYYYRVISEDISANSATEPEPPAVPFSFMTPLEDCFVDETAADFGAGTLTGTYLSLFKDGIMLQPTAGNEFTILPPAGEWASFPWTGGTSTVSGGMVSVDGARYNSEPEALTFSPGATLEFMATFGESGFQHVGFGGGTDATGSGGIYNGESNWAMFSTHNTTNTVKARTFNGTISSDITFAGSGALVGTPHLYRIVWGLTAVDFFVDNILVHTEPLVVGGTMRPAMSDFNNGGPALLVDWIHASPFLSPGTFESQVYDAGAQRLWGTATWTEELPVGTSLQIGQRQGNTAIPDGTWTTFSTIATNGAAVGGTSRYIQYKATLSTTNPAQTPVLKDIVFTCAPPAGVSPAITVKGNNTAIANRSQTVSLADHTDFGSANVSGGTISRTFTIENVVNGLPLVLDGVPFVTIADKDQVDFAVVSQPTTPIAGGSNASFTITFDPGTTGLRTAIVIITHNDLPQNPYVFTINGTGL